MFNAAQNVAATQLCCRDIRSAMADGQFALFASRGLTSAPVHAAG